MTDKNAQRLRNYLDTAHKSGVRLLHLSTDELEGLLDELESAKKRIAELREWNVGLSQESFTHQQRIAELEAQRFSFSDSKLLSLAKDIVENLVDTGASDPEYTQQYVDWTRKRIRAAGIGKGE